MGVGGVVSELVDRGVDDVVVDSSPSYNVIFSRKAPSAQSEGLFCRCCAVVFLAVVSSSLSLPLCVCNISCAADRAVALPTAIACAYSPIMAHSFAPQPSHTTRPLTAASCARFGEGDGRAARGLGHGRERGQKSFGEPASVTARSSSCARTGRLRLIKAGTDG